MEIPLIEWESTIKQVRELLEECFDNWQTIKNITIDTSWKIAKIVYEINS